MQKEHIFNYSSEKVFNTLVDSLKEEVKSITDIYYDDLEGIKYTQQGTVKNLEYNIVSCNLKSGYKLEITEDDSTKYLLNISLEDLDENQCKMIYINDFESSKKLKKLNYKISMFFFKRRVYRRYGYFINYLENKLEEK